MPCLALKSSEEATPYKKVFLIQLDCKCFSESVLMDSSLIKVFFGCVMV